MENNNIPQGYKASAVGVIPSDWEVRRLGEVGSIVSGLTYSPEDVTTEDNGILVLRSSNIQNKQLVFDDNVYVNVEKFNSVKTNDILICVRNGSRNLIGKNALITNQVEGVAFGAFMSVFRSEMSSYLIHLFDTDSFNRNVHKNLGATINSINGSELKEFKFALPPLAEQERIAEVLGCWDVAIEKQGALVEKLTERKRALMQQLLTAKKRLPNFSAPWQTVRLGDYFTAVKDVCNDVTQYQPMTISAKLGLISQQSKFDRIIAGGSLSKYTLLQKNDFAYNKGNSKSYPMGCIYKLSALDYALVPFVYICFRGNENINIEFYQQWFKNKGLDRQLQQIITSGARADGLLNVNTNDFFNLRINLPSLEEQTAIAQILTTADREIEQATAKLQALRTQKRGLMQQLLSGKKRLKI